jgi:curved DNA-binding protein CbpA
LVPSCPCRIIVLIFFFFCCLCSDRNIGNEESAQEYFKELSTAYDALKDPTRRKYYDTNRDAILSGDDSFPSHGDYQDDEDLSTEPTPMKLNKYFYYCDENFARYEEEEGEGGEGAGQGKGKETNTPHDFYTIFSQLFTQLSAHELTAYQNLSKKDQKKALNSLKLSSSSFGDASTSAENILLFYQIWRNFSTILSFEWTDLTPDQIADYYHTMLGEETAFGLMNENGSYDEITFNKSHRKHVKSEYNHRIQELLDLLERYDKRFQRSVQEIKLQQKEIKKLNRSKKYSDEKNTSGGPMSGDLPTPPSLSVSEVSVDGGVGGVGGSGDVEEEKIQIWNQNLVQQLRNSGGVNESEENENQLSKTEKDKLKKMQSKVRNVFRKLMKLILTEATVDPASSALLPEIREDLELVLDRVIAFCPVTLLQEMNTQIGGEVALKDLTLLNLSRGISLLNYSHHITLQYDQATQLFLTREKILKKFPQRSSLVNNLHRLRWQNHQWTDRERAVLRSVYEEIVTPSLTTNDILFYIPNKQLPLTDTSSLWKYLTITVNYILWITPLINPGTSSPEIGIEISQILSSERIDATSVLKLLEKEKNQIEEECYLFSEEEVRRALFYLLKE